MQPKLYTVEEVAEITGMSKHWLWRQCRNKAVPHHSMGRRYRFSEADLRALFDSTRVDAVEDDLVPVGRG